MAVSSFCDRHYTKKKPKPPAEIESARTKPNQQTPHGNFQFPRHGKGVYSKNKALVFSSRNPIRHHLFVLRSGPAGGGKGGVAS